MAKPIKQTITKIIDGDVLNPTVANQPVIDLESNIDQLIDYLDTASTGYFDEDTTTTTALVFGWRAGKFRKNNTIVSISASTLSLTGTATNYLEINPSTNTITSNPTGFTDGNIPLWELTTDASSITSKVDVRTMNISALALTDNGNLLIGTSTDNGTDKLQITGTSYFSDYITIDNASGDILVTDGGDSRFVVHDGGGDLRIHNGSYFGTSDQYVTTGDGAANISLSSGGAGGDIYLRTAVIGTAAASISYASEFSVRTDGFYFEGNSIIIDNVESIQGKNTIGTAYNLIQRDSGNTTIVGTTSYALEINTPTNPTWYTGAATHQFHTTGVTTYMDSDVYLGGDTSNGATRLIGVDDSTDTIYIGGIDATTATQNTLAIRLNGNDKIVLSTGINYMKQSMTVEGNIVATGATPYLRMINTGSVVNEGTWQHIVGGTTYYFRAYDDAASGSGDVFTATRTGTIVDSFNIKSTRLYHNSNDVFVNNVLPTGVTGWTLNAAGIDFIVNDSTDADATNIIWKDNGVALYLGSDNHPVRIRSDLYMDTSSDSIIMTGGNITGVNYLRLTSVVDASLSSTGHAFQIGADNTSNLVIDNNEINVRNNGAATTLYLNSTGGGVTLGDLSSSVTSAGNTYLGTAGGGNSVAILNQDATNEGGQCTWVGAGSYYNHYIDNYQGHARIIYSSSNTTTRYLEITNSGTGGAGITLEAHTAIRDINDGWLRIVDTGGYANGVYTGIYDIRTDGSLQVGATGSTFNADSSELTYNNNPIWHSQNSNLAYYKDVGYGSALEWRKIADVVFDTSTYSGIAYKIEIEDIGVNWGGSFNDEDSRSFIFYIQMSRSGAVLNDSDYAEIHSDRSTSYVRIIRASLGNFELQVNSPAVNHELRVSVSEVSEGNHTTIWVDTPVVSATAGTTYTPTIKAHYKNAEQLIRLDASSGADFITFENTGGSNDMKLQISSSDNFVMTPFPSGSQDLNHQFYYDYSNTRWVFDTAPYVSSNTVWHQGNDGSGSGLDADLLDGTHRDAVWNTATTATVVQRSSSGYISAPFFNTAASVTTTTASHMFIETGSDSYIRKQTPSQFISNHDLLTATTAASTYRKQYSGCTATTSAVVSVASATWQNINFNAEDHDTDTWHSTVTNAHLFEVPAGATRVRISIGITWNAAPNSSGFRTIRIYKNGTGLTVGGQAIQMYGAGTTLDFTQTIPSIVVNCVDTDDFSVYVYQNSGVELNIQAAGTFFSIEAVNQ